MRDTLSESPALATVASLAVADAPPPRGICGTLLSTRVLASAPRVHQDIHCRRRSACAAAAAAVGGQSVSLALASCFMQRGARPSAAAPRGRSQPTPPHRFSRKKEVAAERRGEAARGGRGCSSPERTFRPLDVRVESSTHFMSSSSAPPPSERGRAGQCKARSRTPSSDGPTRRRHGWAGRQARLRRRSPAGLANTVAAARRRRRRSLGRLRCATDGRLRVSSSPSACGRRRRDGGRCRGDYNYTEISPTIEASQNTFVNLK